MNKLMSTAALLALTASGAVAGGIDRSNHAIGILFEEGNYMELSFGNVSPSVSSVAGGMSDATSSYQQLGVGVKMDVNERVSLAFIYEQPIGAEIQYNDGAFQGGRADVSSNGFMFLGRYKMDGGFSVHGGLRAQSAGGSIVSRPSNTPLQPTFLEADADLAFAGVVGVAYEKPEIALRVALTYFSGIKNSFTGREIQIDGSGNPIAAPVATAFDVDFPQSVNLDFQTGIAQDTLLFGSIRWADWEGVELTTPGGGNYIDFDQTTISYNLGIGRRLNENWSVAASIGYESGDGTGSTLGPTSGYRSLGLGATWTEGNTKVSMGVRYVELGDATASALNVPFTDNSAWGAGVKVGWSF
ncbi:hypothetical protein [Thalassobius sp. I31.1]|uniref:hypothetical protein n=1 Tax=Thalassobius sp. I31.1 TaxID=2109912 RepID=UPI000D1A0735|nr:hypothetical protein [Thalassobius sp. I31.1]